MDTPKFIRRIHGNFEDLNTAFGKSNFLWQNENVYVMDNHLSAAWCWLQQCEINGQYNFMHIDRHYDMLECFYDDDLLPIKNNPHLSYDYFTSLKCSHCDYPLFRWDNYIMPIYILYPKWFQTNILITQKQGCVGQSWGHKSFDYNEEEPKNIHIILERYINSAFCLDNNVKVNNLPWIINIDIDVFYDINEPNHKITSDEDIILLSKTINNNIKKIKVLTIALSPSCIYPSDDKEEQWKNAFSVLKSMSSEITLLKSFPYIL